MSDSEPRRAIDLNADLGEGCANDSALVRLVTSASLSCGAHAGSAEVIVPTARLAVECGVVVGAHPGYADRAHFGRKPHALSESEAEDLILEQVNDLICMIAGTPARVRYVKPHGALYNQAQREAAIARGIASACRALGLPLLGQPGSAAETAARGLGVRYIAEGFPDRRMGADGLLVPREEPGAVLASAAEVRANVARLLDDPRLATLCIHGDDPRAVANAELVRTAIRERGAGICPFLEP